MFNGFPCKECNCERVYKNKQDAKLSEHKLCKSCNSKGNRNGFYGKSNSDEHKLKLLKCRLGTITSDDVKLKMSKTQLNRYQDKKERIKTSKSIKEAMNRPDVRKKHLDALHNSQWLKVKMDKGQLELIEKWNKLGFNFEINYQVKTDQDLFYIDGYDPIHNVVLEYDSKYHQRLGQKQKDLLRQQKIINILKPKKFWRYDSINRHYKNVI